MNSSLSRYAEILISALEQAEEVKGAKRITVNRLISKFATWYEKFRNAMDYREEEVVLRAAIERIIKRRILLGGTGKTIAEPLVRELVWARYFPDNSLSESSIDRVASKIDIYLDLRSRIVARHELSENVVNEWIYQLMSSDIEQTLHPNKEKEILANFMFQMLKSYVTLAQEDEQTKDAQVFIAVRRSFAKDDIAFLRFHLFSQFFGPVSRESVEHIGQDFINGYKEIQKQLNHPRKERIYGYVKNKTAVFFILEDLLQAERGNMRTLVQDETELKKAVFAACNARYQGIALKVRRAIVRSVIFILLTKVFIAFSVEGSIESLLYGNIAWRSIIINTTIPPLLMVGVGFFLRPPGDENSERIFSYIKTLLFDEDPKLGTSLVIDKKTEQSNPLLNNVFTILWLLAFILSFGIFVFILTKLQFYFISQAVFLFFLSLVSFLTYRIGLMSRMYTVEERPGVIAPVIDFFFMPIVRVGRHLTEGISQINILLFIFDFIIETPFKGLFSFFEQWFFFLHAKREELG